MIIRIPALLCSCLLLIGIQSISYAQTYQWTRTFGGGNQDYTYGLTSTVNGNAISVGSFRGIADFNPGQLILNITSNGNQDAFIENLDVFGNLVWNRTVGGPGNDYAIAVTANPSGDVFVTGVFNDSVDMDPDTGVAMVYSSGGADIFILKLDSAGNFGWVQTIGSPDDEDVSGITKDGLGNLFIVGKFGDINPLDLDPGPGNDDHTSNGNTDIFIVGLTSSGNYLWGVSFGGSGGDVPYGIATDLTGNVFSTGAFRNTVDFDPGTGVDDQTSSGQQDVFVQKLSGLGSYIWARTFGGSTDNDYGTGIGTDHSGNVVTTGKFNGSVDFDPGAGVNIQSDLGGGGEFLQKLDSGGDLLWANTIASNTGFITSNALFIDGADNVYTTGTVTGSMDFDPSFNSDFQSGNPNSAFVQKIDGTGAYVWTKVIPGQSSGNGVFVDPMDNLLMAGTYTGVVDFDPDFGVDLKPSLGSTDNYIFKYGYCSASYSMDSVNTCDTYTSPSGDSIWMYSGVYFDTIMNSWGCDSFITVVLTIDTVEIGVTQNGDTLTANFSGATYQWFKCMPAFIPLAGENNQGLIASTNGSYAVEITYNGCIDTSDCYAVTTVSNQESFFNSGITIAPNPVSEVLSIALENKDFYTLKLHDSTGRVIKQESFLGSEYLLNLENCIPGLYFLEVLNGSTIGFYKVIKQ